MSVPDNIPHNDPQLTWTKHKPGKAGWYWMLNPEEEPGLPTIVQVVYDWKSRHLIALVPASRYPTLDSAVVDPQKVDALWAGPLAIPSVTRARHRAALAGQQEDDGRDIAA
ncbi:MAG TPA: hypothetical protein VJL88_09745 [Nitrospira sp.]|nr:hypothetical protein [Nitrospira sp.]